MLDKAVSFFFLCFFAAGSLEAMSLRLHNETSSPLNAVIIGADGSLLGKTEIGPKEIVSWLQDSSREKNSFRGPSKSLTPMHVEWFYPDGELFRISEDATRGALIKTGQGNGKRAPVMKELSQEDDL